MAHEQPFINMKIWILHPYIDYCRRISRTYFTDTSIVNILVDVSCTFRCAHIIRFNNSTTWTYLNIKLSIFRRTPVVFTLAIELLARWYRIWPDEDTGSVEGLLCGKNRISYTFVLFICFKLPPSLPRRSTRTTTPFHVSHDTNRYLAVGPAQS